MLFYALCKYFNTIFSAFLNTNCDASYLLGTLLINFNVDFDLAGFAAVVAVALYYVGGECH